MSVQEYLPGIALEKKKFPNDKSKKNSVPFNLPLPSMKSRLLQDFKQIDQTSINDIHKGNEKILNSNWNTKEKSKTLASS